MKTEIYSQFKQIGTNYQVVYKFSDNPYYMIFTGELDKCNKIYYLMEERIDNFFNRKSNTLNTSDLGFIYKKKFNID
jgi:hypothetical protein